MEVKTFDIEIYFVQHKLTNLLFFRIPTVVL